MARRGLCGLKEDRLTSYWSVIAPEKSENELFAERWLLVIPCGSDKYLPPLCKITYQRWMLFLAAFVAQFCNGSLYAWSILNTPIDKVMQDKETNLTQKAVVTFYIACGFLGVASSLFGPFVERYGPRASLMLGTLLIFVGHFLAFVSIQAKWYIALYAGYGLFCGMGFGINYIAPVSALQKWYPDLRGTAGGFAVCGFGAGAAIWGALYEPLIASIGIGNLFVVMGSGISAILLTTSFILRTPPHDYVVKGRDVHGVKVTTALLHKQDQKPSFQDRADRVSAVLGDIQIVNYVKVYDYQEEELGEAELFYHNKVKNLRLRDCIVSIDFFFLYIMFLSTVATGIIIMSRVYNMAKDIYHIQDDKKLTNLVMLLAVFNFLGRLLCPIASDGIIRVAILNPAFGRKLMLGAILIIQLVILLLMPNLIRDDTTFDIFQYLMYALTFSYGGSLGTIPSFLTDMYGVYNTGTMHGVILTCWSLCAVVGGLTFSAIFDSLEQTVGRVEAYVFNFQWLIIVVAVGCALLPLIRTNPVDRFFPGYQYSINGLPIVRIVRYHE